MTKYWLFALIAHPIHAVRLLWINRQQRPPSGLFKSIGRSLFQTDFGAHFHRCSNLARSWNLGG